MNDAVNDMMKLRDEMFKYRIMYEEMNHRYNKLKKCFESTLEETMEYRNVLGYEDNRDWRYDKYEQSGLLDDFE